MTFEIVDGEVRFRCETCAEMFPVARDCDEHETTCAGGEEATAK